MRLSHGIPMAMQTARSSMARQPVIGSLSTNGVMAKDHTISLSNLLPGTVYHFQVISVDLAGNRAVSADLTFTTTTHRLHSLTRHQFTGVMEMMMEEALAQTTRSRGRGHFNNLLSLNSRSNPLLFNRHNNPAVKTRYHRTLRYNPLHKNKNNTMNPSRFSRSRPSLSRRYSHGGLPAPF